MYKIAMNNKNELIETMKQLLKYQQEEIKQLKNENEQLTDMIFIIPEIEKMTGKKNKHKNKKRD